MIRDHSRNFTFNFSNNRTLIIFINIVMCYWTRCLKFLKRLYARCFEIVFLEIVQENTMLYNIGKKVLFVSIQRM